MISAPTPQPGRDSWISHNRNDACRIRSRRRDRSNLGGHDENAPAVSPEPRPKVPRDNQSSIESFGTNYIALRRRASLRLAPWTSQRLVLLILPAAPPVWRQTRDTLTL